MQVFSGEQQLQQHIQPAGPLPSTAALWEQHLRCASCQRLAASACSADAHARIHHQRPPFVCPECGREFLTWTTFKMHLGRTCFHDARSLLYVCPFCAASVHFSHKDAVIDHLMACHVRTAWKCSHCSRAFAQKEGLRDHARRTHRGRRTPYYRLYRPPLVTGSAVLPSSSNLCFKSREALRTYLASEVELPVRLGYACNGCGQACFLQPDELLSHAQVCGHSFTADPLYTQQELEDSYMEVRPWQRHFSQILKVVFPKAMFRIGIYLIRIQHFRLHTDPDLDPIRIQCFDDKKLTVAATF
jgi:hypothetical protein